MCACTSYRSFRGLTVLLSLILIVGIAGCGDSRVRRPVPEELVNVAHVPGMPDVRTSSGQAGAAEFRRSLVESIVQEGDRYVGPDGMRHWDILALSGGGANGAYGAGVLNGWTDSGTRPEFKIVTGVSTGALGATFAFLGPAYDAELQRVYTTVHTDDILRRRSVFGWTDALSDSHPLAGLIAECCTPEVVAQVAAEHAAGRRLYVGTTDLDEDLFVIWDMGAIASYGTPEAVELYRQVLLASASIPIVFPPVYLDVEANGEMYDEMHVDGGVKAQVFVGGILIDSDAVAAESGVDPDSIQCDIYIIRNGRLRLGYSQVEPNLSAIGSKTVTSMINFNAVGDLYRIYLVSGLRGANFNLAYIPEDYVSEGDEQFDPEEMTRLFNLGYGEAQAGYPWRTTPPGLPTDVVDIVEEE